MLGPEQRAIQKCQWVNALEAVLNQLWIGHWGTSGPASLLLGWESSKACSVPSFRVHQRTELQLLTVVTCLQTHCVFSAFFSPSLTYGCSLGSTPIKPSCPWACTCAHKVWENPCQNSLFNLWTVKMKTWDREYGRGHASLSFSLNFFPEDY